MLTYLKLNNFQLFKETEITFDKINIIKGINLDDIGNSSNGSGKSTLIKNAISFALYGDVSGLLLKDLIKTGEKEAFVELHFSLGKDIIKIIRKIPSDLIIYLNDKEIVANTLSFKQKFIDEQLGSFELFKKYHLIDTSGINLLDLGIVSLRKELMKYVDDIFNKIRERLLQKKLERETYNKDKRFYSYFLSEAKLSKLNSGLNELNVFLEKCKENYSSQLSIVNNIKSDILSKEKILYYKQAEIKKLNKGICPVLNSECLQLTQKINNNSEYQNEIREIEKTIKELKEQLIYEEEALKHFLDTKTFLENKILKTSEYISKLNEAFKFANYKYTNRDVFLYSESIKVLDEFAGYFLNLWLNQLAQIINNLLKNVNLKVEFNTDKNFIKIYNEEIELKYEQLSSGQKCFLSAIFKIAMQIHKGSSLDIIIADEGLNNMDAINFVKFVDICQNLPFQFFIVYQNAPNIENAKIITVKREKGVSYVY